MKKYLLKQPASFPAQLYATTEGGGGGELKSFSCYQETAKKSVLKN